MVHLIKSTFVILSLLTATFLFAQAQKQTKLIPSKGIRVAIIKSNGNSAIKSITTGDIYIDAQISATGSVYGWKKNSTPPLDIITERHNDTLIITTTPVNQVWTVGYSTYHETLELNICLPSSVTVIAADCEDDLYIDLAKQNINSFVCNANDELIVNGEKKENQFEFGSIGAQNVKLKAKNIHTFLR